ncbi:MAG: hypothetical protein V7717_03555 [Porticoccaceae bacterium]
MKYRSQFLYGGFIILVVILSAYAASSYTENKIGREHLELLYTRSAVEVKTFTKLLELVRGDDKERTIKYLEALLFSSKSMLEATSKHASTNVKESIGKEAVDHMKNYMNKYPSSEMHSNQSLNR